METIKKEKYAYFTRNLIRGLIWLAILGVLFWVFKTYFDSWYTAIMDQIANKPILVLTTFTLSEILFGIFPPELFMIWALQQGSAADYIFYSAILGAISYVAGVIGYFIGRQISQTHLYARFRERWGEQLELNVKRYGGFMIFIAAMTPVPFSAICMITGASRYRFVNFLLIGTSRLLRFALYAYVIWGVNTI